MIYIKAGKNVEVCVEDGAVTGLYVKTADGKVFVRLENPQELLDTLLANGGKGLEVTG